MSVRIGPMMREVLSLASRPGGIARIDAARRVGPYGSLSYGYATVNRVIKAGLVATGYVSSRRGLMISTL